MMEDQMDPHRPLSEVGFDSLMLLELVMGVERMTGLKLRMVGASERTLMMIAIEILNELFNPTGATSQDSDPAQTPAQFKPKEPHSTSHPDKDLSLQAQSAAVAQKER
jgi:hypothetical protein